MKWYTRSCERPRKRPASDAAPSPVSNRYGLSIRTHGSSCRRRASSSLIRVSSFSASSSSSRAASHSLRVPVLCLVITVPSLSRGFFRERVLVVKSRVRYVERGSDKCDGIPMDPLIAAAARALAAGDPLGALKGIARRDDAPALALRGIAMAQVGDFVRAKTLVRRAARAFGPTDIVPRARCVVALAAIAIVTPDLGWPAKALASARATLAEHGDRVNAAYARYLEVRRLLLIGHLDEAERTIAELDPAPLPPASRTVYELVMTGIAVRRLRMNMARAAL